MIKKYKTFYSVTYTGFGFCGKSIAWFDNKKEADEFAKQDYTDAPVRHTFSDPDRIAEHEYLVYCSDDELCECIEDASDWEICEIYGLLAERAEIDLNYNNGHWESDIDKAIEKLRKED